MGENLNRVTRLRRRTAWPLLLAAAAVLAGWAPRAGAQLTVSEVVELSFGSVVDQDGTITLGLSDAIVSDPNAIHMGGAVATGQYEISGDPFASVSIQFAGSTANGLSIYQFDTDQGTPPLSGVALDGDGTLLLRVGATLTVTADECTPGNAQALPFTITVNYE